MELSESFMQRVWKYISPEPMSGCWIWTGAAQGRPKWKYGVIKQEKSRKMLFVHRIFCELEHGPIPEGMLADHKCQTTLCVNPKHLRIVTHRINSIENNSGPTARNANSPTCIRGHKYSETGTRNYIRDGAPRRECLACYRLRLDRRLAKYYSDKAAEKRHGIGGDGE